MLMNSDFLYPPPPTLTPLPHQDPQLRVQLDIKHKPWLTSNSCCFLTAISCYLYTKFCNIFKCINAGSQLPTVKLPYNPYDLLKQRA